MRCAGLRLCQPRIFHGLLDTFSCDSCLQWFCSKRMGPSSKWQLDYGKWSSSSGGVASLQQSSDQPIEIRHWSQKKLTNEHPKKYNPPHSKIHTLLASIKIQAPIGKSCAADRDCRRPPSTCGSAFITAWSRGWFATAYCGGTNIPKHRPFDL